MRLAKRLITHATNASRVSPKDARTSARKLHMTIAFSWLRARRSLREHRFTEPGAPWPKTHVRKYDRPGPKPVMTCMPAPLATFVAAAALATGSGVIAHTERGCALRPLGDSA